MFSSLFASIFLGTAYFGGSFLTMRLLGVEVTVAVSTAMLIGATGWLERVHVDRVAKALQRHHGQHDHACPHCELTQFFMEWVERLEHEDQYVTEKVPFHSRKVAVLDPPEQESNTLLRKLDA